MDKKSLSEEEFREAFKEALMTEIDWDKLRQANQEFSEVMVLMLEDQFNRLSGLFTPEAAIESAERILRGE